MILVISGDVTSERAGELADKYFGSLRDEKTKNYLPVKISQSKPATKIFKKDTEQAHFCLGVRTPQLGNPDRYKIAVLNTLLGAGMSSRLFLEVRERRGLAYYVRSGVEEYLDAGSLTVQAGVEPKNIEEAIKVVLSELAKIASEKIEAEELKKAKEYLKGRLVLELEDSREVGLMFGLQQLLEGKTRTPEYIMGEIDKVSATDVATQASKLFVNQKLNLAIVGPFKDSIKFEKILKW
jgi:predicted Zn-dependent peptidase